MLVGRLLDPQSTIVVLLGAEDWSSAGLPRARSFARSSKGILHYLLDSSGMNIDPDRLIDYFDHATSAAEQLVNLRRAMDTKISDARELGRPISDVLIYYIGHGQTDDSGNLALLVRNSVAGMETETGIKAAELARVLKVAAPQQRRVVILDCCFSEAAAKGFHGMGLLDTAVAAMAVRPFADDIPQRGTVLLCSSPVGQVSIGQPDAHRTLFTGALLDVLNNGVVGRPNHFSMADLRDATYDSMLNAIGSMAPRPILHQTNAQSGDLTKVPVFANRAKRKGRSVSQRLATRVDSVTADKETLRQAQEAARRELELRKEAEAALRDERLARDVAIREAQAAARRAEREALEEKLHEAQESAVRENEQRTAAEAALAEAKKAAFEAEKEGAAQSSRTEEKLVTAEAALQEALASLSREALRREVLDVALKDAREVIQLEADKRGLAEAALQEAQKQALERELAAATRAEQEDEYRKTQANALAKAELAAHDEADQRAAAETALEQTVAALHREAERRAALEIALKDAREAIQKEADNRAMAEVALQEAQQQALENEFAAAIREDEEAARTRELSEALASARNSLNRESASRVELEVALREVLRSTSRETEQPAVAEMPAAEGRNQAIEQATSVALRVEEGRHLLWISAVVIQISGWLRRYADIAKPLQSRLDSYLSSIGLFRSVILGMLGSGFLFASAWYFTTEYSRRVVLDLGSVTKDYNSRLENDSGFVETTDDGRIIPSNLGSVVLNKLDAFEDTVVRHNDLEIYNLHSSVAGDQVSLSLDARLLNYESLNCHVVFSQRGILRKSSPFTLLNGNYRINSNVSGFEEHLTGRWTYLDCVSLSGSVVKSNGLQLYQKPIL